MIANVSAETAHASPYTFGVAPMPTVDGRWDYVVYNKHGQEYSRYWGGNTREEIEAAIDRLNTECALFLMIEGTKAEHARP